GRAGGAEGRLQGRDRVRPDQAGRTTAALSGHDAGAGAVWLHGPDAAGRRSGADDRVVREPSPPGRLNARPPTRYPMRDKDGCELSVIVPLVRGRNSERECLASWTHGQT